MVGSKYLVEFVGTFFLVLTAGMVVIEPGAAAGLAPLAIAGVLTAMVYAGGHVSGAHYNPAVTLAVTLRGKCSVRDAIGYVLAQVAGAVIAAMVVLWFKEGGSPVVPREIKVQPALAAEVLFTFALAYVILNVATAKGTAGNPYFGIAIGLAVLGGVYAAGPYSGGVLNPAVTVAVVIMGLLKASDCWIHIVGEVVGAVLAAVVFKLTARD